VCPGQTAKEIASVARREGFDVRRGDVNSLLYRHRHLFARSDATVPAWSLLAAAYARRVATAAAPAVAPPPPPSPVRQVGEPPAKRSGLSDGVLRPAGERRESPAVLGVRVPITLYGWQHDALEAWARQGHRGIVEAVTGTGKTRVGIAAIQEAVGLGGCAHVLVPTIDLLEQWCEELRIHLPGVRLGRRGDGWSDRFADRDLIVSVVNSARDYPIERLPAHSLLVADECHRYGAKANAQSLQGAFSRRLGLTATYAREDDGNLAYLDPYFGETCFRIGYRRAVADDVTAHFKVALIGIDFADAAERNRYETAELWAGTARSWLVKNGWVAPEPYRQFVADMLAVQQGFPRRSGSGAKLAAMKKAAEYLKQTTDKRRVLAESGSKKQHVELLLPAIEQASRTLVFTESIEAAREIAARLSGSGRITATALHSQLGRDERKDLLGRFKAGHIRAVVAPRVLDEGVDVPEADLAIIAASSKTRRQMVQRMGRVLRRKADGRLARFAVLYLKGTTEDPTRGTHESFLEEVTDVADEPPMVFDAASERSEVIDYLNDYKPATTQPPR
jgi:RNA polymerase primary sigma factor